MTKHLEITATIRTAIKAAGIKARVRKQTICGTRSVQVYTVSHTTNFSAGECRRIAEIAKGFGLTDARRSEIDPDHAAQLTGKAVWNFEFHAA
jgi:hypothetical protein